MVIFTFCTDGQSVSFGNFCDEHMNHYAPNEISKFFPGMGVNDIKKIGQDRLRELKKIGMIKSGDHFGVEYDGK